MSIGTQLFYKKKENSLSLELHNGGGANELRSLLFVNFDDDDNMV